MPSRLNPLPATIGRFRVEALLGTGGMGEVYKAFDPTLQRTVAVKTVRPDIDRPEYLERLYREAQACARLQHRNIVTVYEAGEIGGVVYIAMEFLKGEDLAAVLRRGELSFEAKIRVLIQVLEALEHAHANDVIHRDIKPSNVHRQSDGSVKVVDFGLARVVQAQTLTLTGMVLCTPQYASPEQLKGLQVDKRTDIYSTGVLAYQMLSGRCPFGSDNDSVATIVLKVISEPPPPMNVSWTRTFPEIERIVSRAMAKSPDERYQSAEDMRNALAAFLSSSRDAIASAQAQANVSAQLTIIEARNLLAAGMKTDAQALLAETLRLNPDAGDVRKLLDETSTVAPSPAGERTLPVERRDPPPNLTPASDVRPGPAAVMSSHGPVTAAGPVTLPLSGSVTVVPTPRRSRTLWWTGAAAAAIVVAAAVILPRLSAPTTDGPVVGDARPPATNQTVGATVPPVVDTPSGAGAPANQSAALAQGSEPARVPGVSTPTNPSGQGVKPGDPPQATPPATVARVVSAKQLFFGDGKTTASGTASTWPGGSTAQALNAGLRYRLIQQAPGATEADVDPLTEFRSGDRVRFAFESNIDGYLYVAQLGTSGRWTVLFPSPEINGGRNAIKGFEQYPVPNDGWFLFDATPGTEEVFVFLSREPLNQLPGFDRPVTKPETVMASVVQDLQQRIRSRDLMFQKDQSDSSGGKPSMVTYVVNRDEVGKAVAASIQLKHGQ